MIGGYAVDAYSPLPRYSADCDLVIPKSDFEDLSEIFLQNGFKEKARIYLDELGGLESWKFRKLVKSEPISIELLLDGVKCRQTEAIWIWEEINASASERRVVGVSGSVLSNIASKELLLTMKLHSGRDADLRDATTIIDSIDWTKVEEFSSRGNMKKVIDQLTMDIVKIERPGFEQELKAYFSSKVQEDKRLRRASANIAKLRKKTIEAKPC